MCAKALKWVEMAFVLGKRTLLCVRKPAKRGEQEPGGPMIRTENHEGGGTGRFGTLRHEGKEGRLEGIWGG
jgi:hypothetical protein